MDSEGAAGEDENAHPASTDLPARPVLRSLTRWVDIQWPAASPQEIVAKGSAFTPGQMIKVGWKLVLVTFFMNIWSKIDGDVISPYLNSCVYCCGGEFDAPALGEHYDITDNATLLFFAEYFGETDQDGSPLPLIAGCDLPQIVDAASSDDDELMDHWSLSAHCPSKAYVLDRTQFVRGWVYQIGNWFAILVLPLGGHVGDCWGARRFM